MRDATCLVPSTKRVRERRCLFVSCIQTNEPDRTGPDRTGRCECEIFKRFFFNLIASHLALNPSNRDDDAGTTTMDDVRLSDGFDDR